MGAGGSRHVVPRPGGLEGLQGDGSDGSGPTGGELLPHRHRALLYRGSPGLSHGEGGEVAGAALGVPGGSGRHVAYHRLDGKTDPARHTAAPAAEPGPPCCMTNTASPKGPGPHAQDPQCAQCFWAGRCLHCRERQHPAALRLRLMFLKVPGLGVPGSRAGAGPGPAASA